MELTREKKIGDLLKSAKDILIRNDAGKYTVPSGHLYPHMWAWDSAFAAMGWAHIDISRAQEELSLLLQNSWQNGMVPHITFDHRYIKEYFPGPDVWGRAKSSTISQPPVWAIALEYLLLKGADTEWVKSMVPSIEKSHLFYSKYRDPENLNLVTVVHPWESGMDNCVGWDNPMSNVSTMIQSKLNRIDNKKITDSSQRPSDTEYMRYIRIVEETRDRDDCIPESFQTYDPMMSSILCMAEHALARIKRTLNLDDKETLLRAKRIKKAILSLETKGGYFPYVDVLKNEKYYVKSLGALFPYIIAETEEPSILSNHICKYGLTTHSIDDSSFDPKCYWRGPCWINTNWFFSKIQKHSVDGTLSAIEKSGFHEYFHPETGEGLGSDNFSWSAALFLVTFDN